jgi:hypothetical protein
VPLATARLVIDDDDGCTSAAKSVWLSGCSLMSTRSATGSP